MCGFIDMMNQLKSSSSSSVANENFSDFNEYMHTESKMDGQLSEVIIEAEKYFKALVLVCGNSGDGKSHLIAKLKRQGIIRTDKFDIYIDATSSDKKGVKANEKLREKLSPLSDKEIGNGKDFRLIIAINLGILNDFIKNYGDEFKILQKYVEEQDLFGNVPTWKYYLLKDGQKVQNDYYIGHVDFTSFHRYEITKDGLNLDFIRGLLNKIVVESSENPMYNSFNSDCSNCPKKSNCPVFWNYSTLVKNEKRREYILNILAKAIIKNNITPSVREINDFFYEIIIGGTFEESMINYNSITRLTHFVENLTLNLLFESSEGLLNYLSEEDVLNNDSSYSDKKLIELNLKPSFEKWIKEEAVLEGAEFKQINSDISYCESNFAKDYKEKEDAIRKNIYKYYIRSIDVDNIKEDAEYKDFLKYLYCYNIGDERGCQNLINLVRNSIYTWNGRLCNSSGSKIKNAVALGKNTEKYLLFKKIELQFLKDKNIKKLDREITFTNFSTTLKFKFRLKEKLSNEISIDVDYELYKFLLDLNDGYVPSYSDRKKNVKYDSFVRILLSESDSDLYVYSRNENGKTYVIRKDEFGGYVFENEV